MSTPVFSSKEPPRWKEAMEVFGMLPWEEAKGIVCAYDGVIYTKEDQLAPDVVAHEMVHIRQQQDYRDGVDAAVDRYNTEPLFRYQMELDAYATQYCFVVSNVLLDGSERHLLLKKLARELSGPMYLHVVSYTRAFSDLKRVCAQFQRGTNK